MIRKLILVSAALGILIVGNAHVVAMDPRDNGMSDFTGGGGSGRLPLDSNASIKLKYNDAIRMISQMDTDLRVLDTKLRVLELLREFYLKCQKDGRSDIRKKESLQELGLEGAQAARAKGQPAAPRAVSNFNIPVGHQLVRTSPDGDCMFNAVMKGSRRIRGNDGDGITLDAIRAHVADELDKNLDEYEHALVNQMHENVRDQGLAGRDQGLAGYGSKGDLIYDALNELANTRQTRIEARVNELRALLLDEDDSTILQQAQEAIDGEIREAIQDLVIFYIDKVRERGFWGGHVELVILSKRMGVQIIVHRNDGRVNPAINNTGNPNAPIVRLAYNGDHYDLIAEAEAPAEVAGGQTEAVVPETESGAAAAEPNPSPAAPPLVAPPAGLAVATAAAVISIGKSLSRKKSRIFPIS